MGLCSQLVLCSQRDSSYTSIARVISQALLYRVMAFKQLHILCAILYLLVSSAFLTGGFHRHIKSVTTKPQRQEDLSTKLAFSASTLRNDRHNTVLFSVKRRPDRFTEWEVRKKSETNQKNTTSNSNSGMKSSTYRNSIADSNRIADSTSLANRKLKPLVTPTPVLDMSKHEDYETGLVIERLGGSLLVEVQGKEGAPTYNVVCYQRSNLCDSQIVVGDNVNLLIVKTSNGTVANNATGSSTDSSIESDSSVIGEITSTSSSNDISTIISSSGGDRGGDSSSSVDFIANFLSRSEEDETEFLLTGIIPENILENADENIINSIASEQSSERSTETVSIPLAPPALPLQGVVLGHHERLNLLQRPSPFNSVSNAKNKAIAANIDQIILVMSAVPIVPLSSVDRILVAANEYDMDAIILLNKMDLEGSEELFNDLKRYERMGYKLLKVSVKTKEGLEEFRDTLKDKCSVFVGQSGIGKSSLVNTLLPDADYKAKIGALVRSANLGAHTTSSARLFHLPGGGRIIDSPGKIRAR